MDARAVRTGQQTLVHPRPIELLAALPGGAPPRDPDLRRRLDRAVASLDENHRLVFVMHDLEGYTHQEIAAAMGTPVGTAKARLSRARARLRNLLLGPGPGPGRLAAAETD
ncbi:MAG: sigma-70 family RNA polymerase sigma factor [Candidatus Krumholzibacteriia bacterium]